MHLDQVRGLITAYPDFPKPGILFQDIFPLFQNPEALQSLLDGLLTTIRERYSEPVEAIIGLDARGFLFGPSIALALKCPFVPVRKAGKLPGRTIRVGYEKEYGMDFFEMQEGDVLRGKNCLILDDLLATGGSAYAAAELVEKAQGKVAGFLFVIALDECQGERILKQQFSTNIQALFHF